MQDYGQKELILSPKQEAFKILRESGLNQVEASKALGITKSRGCQIQKKLNSSEDLTSKTNIRLAAKAHKKILSHFVDPNKNPLESSIYIKGSDVSKAVDRVYDRVQPIRGQDAGSTNISFYEINIEAYR